MQINPTSSIVGLLLIFAGGASNGSFAVPTKKIRVWTFEQIWLIYSLVATVLLPISLGVIFAPALFHVVFPAHPLLVTETFAFGGLWGAGSVLFALSLKRLGIAISDALTNGTVVLFGSTGPLLIGAVSMRTEGLFRFSLGIFILMLGISACSWASLKRDRSGNAEMQLAPGVSSWIGISLAILAGFVSSMLNIGFAHGRLLLEYANEAGIPPLACSLAIWIPALIGGFVVNLAFTSFQIQKTGSWSRFREGGMQVWLRSFLMGLLWFTCIFLYGFASPMLGHTGAVYGWAINASASIVTSSTWGFILGEWTNASRSAKALLLLGIAAIMCSAFFLSKAISVS